jgi:hypothetical protein
MRRERVTWKDLKPCGTQKKTTLTAEKKRTENFDVASIKEKKKKMPFVVAELLNRKGRKVHGSNKGLQKR